MQGHELGAVGKHRFDLHFAYQLRNALHHLFTAQPGAALGHQGGNGLAVPGALDHLEAEPGNGLGVIQLEAAVEPPLRQQGGGDDQQLVLFLGG